MGFECTRMGFGCTPGVRVYPNGLRVYPHLKCTSTLRCNLFRRQFIHSHTLPTLPGKCIRIANINVVVHRNWWVIEPTALHRKGYRAYFYIRYFTRAGWVKNAVKTLKAVVTDAPSNGARSHICWLYIYCKAQIAYMVQMRFTVQLYQYSFTIILGL